MRLLEQYEQNIKTYQVEGGKRLQQAKEDLQSYLRQRGNTE